MCFVRRKLHHLDIKCREKYRKLCPCHKMPQPKYLFSFHPTDLYSFGQLWLSLENTIFTLYLQTDTTLTTTYRLFFQILLTQSLERTCNEYFDVMRSSVYSAVILHCHREK